MTTIISTAVGFVCGVYMAYIAGKKYGFYKGRGEQRTCTPLMAKACLKGFIRGYVEAKKLSGSERSVNGISSIGVK